MMPGLEESPPRFAPSPADTPDSARRRAMFGFIPGMEDTMELNLEDKGAHDMRTSVTLI